MPTRARMRVGRRALYIPTDAECAAISEPADLQWPATITKVNKDGTAELLVQRSNGTVLDKAAAVLGGQKGQYTFQGVIGD